MYHSLSLFFLLSIFSFACSLFPLSLPLSLFLSFTLFPPLSLCFFRRLSFLSLYLSLFLFLSSFYSLFFLSLALSLSHYLSIYLLFCFFLFRSFSPSFYFLSHPLSFCTSLSFVLSLSLFRFTPSLFSPLSFFRFLFISLSFPLRLSFFLSFFLFRSFTPSFALFLFHSLFFHSISLSLYYFSLSLSLSFHLSFSTPSQSSPFLPVGWGCRIRSLYLCKGVRLPPSTRLTCWPREMLEDRILVAKQFVIRGPNWSRDLRHSILALNGIDESLNRSDPINWPVTSSASTYMIVPNV